MHWHGCIVVTSFGVYDSGTKAAMQKFETMIVNMMKAEWLYVSQNVKKDSVLGSHWHGFNSCLVSFILVSGIYMVWKMRKRNKMGWLFGNDFADAEYVGL